MKISTVKSKSGEEVELEAIAQLGIGLEHAKWQSTLLLLTCTTP